MPNYRSVTTGAFRSTRTCTCANCRRPILRNEDHFRLWCENYSFKLCRTCLTTASSKVNNRWRVAQRKQARLLAEFNMDNDSGGFRQ